MYVELKLQKHRQRDLEYRAKRERLATQMRREWRSARRANTRGLARLVALFL
jgi:hypothetical protein